MTLVKSKFNFKSFLGFMVMFIHILSSCGIKGISSNKKSESTTETTITSTSPDGKSKVNPLIVDKLAAGDGFTCAVEKASNANTPQNTYCWGKNSSNQLGTTNAATSQKTPYLVNELITEFPNFSLGGAFGCMINGSDSVKCWGKNDQFQLGNAQQTNGNSGLIPNNVIDPYTDVPLFISSGRMHTCFYTITNFIQCIGQSSFGAFGTNTIGANTISSTLVTIPATIQSNLLAQRMISSGSMNYLMMNDGSLGCWGGNASFCGLGNTTSPIGFSWVPMPNGVVAKDFIGLSNALCILSQTNQVYCTGNNPNGQLGEGTTGNRTILTLSSTLNGINVRSLASNANNSTTNCIITQSGGVMCFGSNTNGSVGANTTGASQLTPVSVVDASMNPINQVTSVIQIGQQATAGDSSSCALRANGTVWCWGRGSSGQLGNNSTSNSLVAVQAQFPGAVKRLFAGTLGACAILNDESLYCWGANTSGRLGINSVTSPISVPRPILGVRGKIDNVVVGDLHTCVLYTNSGLQCWGTNTNGVLGEANTALVRTTATSAFPYYNGLSSVSAVASGSSHTCLLVQGGFPKCFGNNQSGQLGIGNNRSTSQPTYVSEVPSEIKSMALGEQHSCFLGANGLIYCTGNNSFGQIGNGNFNSLSSIGLASISGATQLASGKNHVCTILADQSAWCWGKNVNGQLGVGNTGRRNTPGLVVLKNEKFLQLAAGSEHTCGLTTNKTIYCWGLNFSGQLGTGNYLNSALPKLVSLSGISVSEIITGDNHTCAKTEDNKMYCWGENDSGQLGNNTAIKSATPVLVELPS